jgi:hypothetical protein
MDAVNTACPCPNTKCKLRGNCKVCRENHRGKTFCVSPKWMQNVMRLVIPKEKQKKKTV